MACGTSRHFLLGGSKGHVALVDALRLDVVRELHLGESVRDVKVRRTDGEGRTPAA